MASSLRGNYRFTNDIDILVELPADRIDDFVRKLGPEFHAESGGCAVHRQSAFKFDLIPAIDEFAVSQLDRRTLEGIFITSAEDVLLAKFRWYRLGGESSEQQWKDVAGIVAVQGDRLDRGYLDRWAGELGVADLLERLLRHE